MSRLWLGIDTQLTRGSKVGSLAYLLSVARVAGHLDRCMDELDVTGDL